MLKQISVFVQNKAGRLAALMEILKENKIDVRALSIADTTDFGIVRLIVSDTDTALKALKDYGCTAKVTDVIGFVIPDHFGALHEVVSALNLSNINVEYCYSLMGKNAGEAEIAIRVDDNEKAVKMLTEKGVSLL